MKTLKKLSIFFVFFFMLILTACNNSVVKVYVINFISNGGSEVEQVRLRSGITANKPDDPIKENYKFTGWYKDVYLSEEFVFPQQMPEKSFNLYAKWEDKDPILKFESNGGTLIDSIEGEALSSIIMPEVPVKENRLFAGWYQDEELTMAFDNKMPINDTTVYAKWVNVEPTTKLVLDKDWTTPETNAYNIEKVVEGSKVTLLPGKGTYSYLGILINQNVKAYSTFVMEIEGTKGEQILLKCQNGGVTAKEQMFTMDGTKNQKLVWTVNPENLTNGLQAMNFYVFVRPGVTGAKDTVVTIKNLELYRLRQDNENYQSVIHFNALGGSGIESLFADSGSQINTPSVEPTKSGYRFVSWCSDESCKIPYVFDLMPDSQTTLYAKWQSNENVTLSFDSLGSTAIDDIVLPSGADISKVKPTDPVKENVIFGGWYLDKDYTSSFDFKIMPELDVTLYARWCKLDDSTAITLTNDLTSTENYVIEKNTDGTVTVKVGTKGTYSMFSSFLTVYAKDYSHFEINFKGTAGKQILFKCQNGFVTAKETKVMMDGTDQQLIWQVTPANLPNGTSPMNFYMCLDPGVAHKEVPTDEIAITIESIKLYRLVEVNSSENGVIHFSSNSDTEIKPIFGEMNSSITLPEEPIKRGSKFSGWYLDQEFTIPFTDYVINKNTQTVYAKWNPIENIEKFVFDNNKWATVPNYLNYSVSSIDNKTEISYNHKDNKWSANAGPCYEINDLPLDSYHYTQLKVTFTLTETLKTEDVNVRFRFFSDAENYIYNSKTPTLQYKVTRASIGEVVEIIIPFSSITNVNQKAHFYELFDAKDFNVLINIYTTSSTNSYGQGTLTITSIQFE